MTTLRFYTTDYQYVQYLQKAELEKRGFSHVPNMDYGKDRKDKFLCGIVLHINNKDYYVPVSSYKLQKPDNLLIHAQNGAVTSSLRFNYMFPIPKEYIFPYDFNNLSNGTYKRLVMQEWNFCNAHREQIYVLAERTYGRVLLGKDKGLVANSCDFLYLEQKCRRYEQVHSIQQHQTLDEQLESAQKQADRQNAGHMLPMQKNAPRLEK